MITFLKLFVNTINLFFPVGVFAFFSETSWGDDVNGEEGSQGEKPGNKFPVL
jgi:hypothetical protein